MKKIKIKQIAILLATLLLSWGCHKEFLDEKPSTSIVQPTTLEEFQGLLDNYDVMNITSGLGVVSADDHLFNSDAIWMSARTATERNAYIWAKDLYEGENAEDWNKPYTTIFYANNVLAGLDKVPINNGNTIQWRYVKGWAHFARAFAYYELMCSFAAPFDPATAGVDTGVPLRTAPSIDELLPRATVSENYGLIFSDLAQASTLLTMLPPAQRNRPSKVAVYALLGRIHLNRGEYDSAERFADSCLMNYDKLMDYNSLSRTAATPFSMSNDELIYSKAALNRASTSAGNTFIRIAPALISLYGQNDLRLAIFFNKQADGSYRMKRGYHGAGLYPFVGLATDEVYLIKAECLARKGSHQQAMDYLNQLLVKRWDINATVPARPFQPLVAPNLDAALQLVLRERRKELVWRGARWEDIKRLNREGANIILQRTVSGANYELLPNSPRYVFPIPDNEIALGGIKQNPR